MTNQEEKIPSDFIVTKEYRRFAEFCDACQKYRYIGLCYGAPGVGKSLSARYYARWDLLEPLWLHYILEKSRPKEIMNCRTVLYTPPVVNTPQAIDKDLERLDHVLRTLVEEALQVHQAEQPQARNAEITPDLMIIDESDRLKMTGLEHMRDRLYLCTFRYSQFKPRKVRIKSQTQCRIGIAHEAKRAHDDDGDAGFPAGPVQC